ncbi:hypothetical protein F4555_000056 [Mobiluncus mulieris]|nr:hypothetical protein [Mobiluncus mulieris]STO16063.1 Uncharacterised protein [Mobiluncus mulieris]STY83984.1 Uncharacterised protein [Mobiluncus mulieris]
MTYLESGDAMVYMQTSMLPIIIGAMLVVVDSILRTAVHIYKPYSVLVDKASRASRLVAYVVYGVYLDNFWFPIIAYVIAIVLSTLVVAVFPFGDKECD